MLVERAYDVEWYGTYPGAVEQLTDWIIAVVRVLDAEPDAKLFPLVAPLMHIAVERTYGTKLDREASHRFVDELREAYVLLRDGDDRHIARAAFVLAFTHATRTSP